MYPLDRARTLAESLVTILAPSCNRLQIAGSIRRQSPMVKDLELVALPCLQTNLFGEPDERSTQLDTLIDHMIVDGQLTKRLNKNNRPHAYGPRYKALVYQGVPVDLFIVRPPAQWGAVLAIRTGPADFSRRLVTSCRYNGLRCDGGRLVTNDGQTVPTPTEEAFFAACGVPWTDPWDRE